MLHDRLTMIFEHNEEANKCREARVAEAVAQTWLLGKLLGGHLDVLDLAVDVAENLSGEASQD